MPIRWRRTCTLHCATGSGCLRRWSADYSRSWRECPNLISGRVLTGQGRTEYAPEEAVRDIEAEVDRTEQGGGFDIDAVIDADLMELPRPPPALTMDDLERVIASPMLLPPGIEVEPMRQREYSFQQPGMRQAVRVSTDPTYYEQNADSIGQCSR